MNNKKIEEILNKCYEFGTDGKITSGIGEDGMVRYTCVFNETRAIKELVELNINTLRDFVKWLDLDDGGKDMYLKEDLESFIKETK